MTAVYLILSLITIVFYLNRKYLPFILCYIALMTELFMLDTIGSAIRGSDMCFFMNIILFPFALMRTNNIKSNEKKINRIVKLFIGFLIFEFLLTVVTRSDTVSYALKVVRIPLMFLAYYIFRTIPLNTYRKFLKIMLYITIAQGVLFLLQFAGVNLLAGRYDSESFAFAFALNVPTFIYLYIFVCLDVQRIRKYRYLLLAFFVTILLMTYVRAFIIAALLGIILYVVMVRGLKRSVLLVAVILLLLPFAQHFVDKKSEVSGSMHSTKEEIALLFSGIDNVRQIGDDGGSSVFRMAMLIERFDYLIHNPEYLLFGVGAIHEDSPNCYNRFSFALGTRNEDRYYGKCLIESGDITWVPITLRYGIVGIVVHLSIIFMIIKLAWRRKDLLRIFFPLLIIYFMKSFDGALFENPLSCVELALYLALFARCFMEEKELYI